MPPRSRPAPGSGRLDCRDSISIPTISCASDTSAASGSTVEMWVARTKSRPLHRYQTSMRGCSADRNTAAPKLPRAHAPRFVPTSSPALCRCPCPCANATRSSGDGFGTFPPVYSAYSETCNAPESSLSVR